LNKYHSFALLCILTILIASATGNTAVITMTDDSSIAAEQIEYADNTLSVVIGSETTRINRNEIKNISFTAQTRTTEVFATDSADLAEILPKAQELLQKYPDAQSILVTEEGNYQHRKDGTNLSRYRCVTYLAQDESLWEAQISLSFDPNRETIRVLHARSYTPDGAVHVLSPDQIKISKGTSGSVYFDQYQDLSFTIPEAAVGGLIDYCYETEEFNPFDRNLFQGRFYFQGSQPVGESVLRVSVPHDKSLHYVVQNVASGTAPEKTEAVDSIIYTWKFTDLPPVISEPSMPAYRNIVPAVYYSLHKDFTYVHEKLRPMFEKRFQLTEAVKEKVNELIEGASNVHEKISRLYQFCQKEIRYISIKGNLASNQVGHPAEDTLKNRYGDCTDKGMLLATMLKHIGVEAYPVGVRTNDTGRAVRDIAIFDDNHCITEVHLDGRIFYLDSTATDYRYPYFRPDNHEAVADNTMLGTLKQVPLPPPEDNAAHITRKIELSADGTTRIEFESTQNGSTESSFRSAARNLKAEEYEKQIREQVSALTADYVLELATHTDPLDFNTQFKARSAYTLNRFATKSGRYMIFAIPFFEMGFAEVSLEKRRYNIEYGTSRLRTDQVEIKIPASFTVKYLPPALRVQSPYVEFEVIYDQQGDSINIKRKLAFPRRIVPVADYNSFKQDLEKIAHASKQKIFLEEKATEGVKP
jgi:transglutaminase-like putative cysteine protease